MLVPEEFKYGPVATKDGLRVNGVNFVPWSNIVSARKVLFLGLPNIQIELSVRRAPFFLKTWHVPLYLGGAENLRRSVAKVCPIDNPFRNAVLEDTPPETIGFFAHFFYLLFPIFISAILIWTIYQWEAG